MKITVKKLSELHKPAHNIRRHSEKQLTEYIRSIEMFGQVKPLVVAEDGEIIAGNGLYESHRKKAHGRGQNRGGNRQAAGHEARRNLPPVRLHQRRVSKYDDQRPRHIL